MEENNVLKFSVMTLWLIVNLRYGSFKSTLIPQLMTILQCSKRWSPECWMTVSNSLWIRYSTISFVTMQSHILSLTTRMMKVCGNYWAILKRESIKKQWAGNSRSSEDDNSIYSKFFIIKFFLYHKFLFEISFKQGNIILNWYLCRKLIGLNRF